MQLHLSRCVVSMTGLQQTARQTCRRAPSSTHLQVVVAQPIAWSANSLYPLTLIGDWNMSDVDVRGGATVAACPPLTPPPPPLLLQVSVDAFIYSRAAYVPDGSPTTSLLPCDASDASQRWFFNASTTLALPGSLVDGALSQCFAVDGCNPAPGTSVWSKSRATYRMSWLPNPRLFFPLRSVALR